MILNIEINFKYNEINKSNDDVEYPLFVWSRWNNMRSEYSQLTERNVNKINMMTRLLDDSDE